MNDLGLLKRHCPADLNRETVFKAGLTATAGFPLSGLKPFKRGVKCLSKW